MEETLEVVRARLKQENTFIGTRQLDQVRRHVASIGPNSGAANYFAALYMLGRLELFHGHEAESITSFGKAADLFPQIRSGLAAADQNRFWFEMGVAYLRMAETQNCCARATPESCILPFRGGALHTQREGSQQASAYFIKVLRNTAPDDPLHLSAQWLLNVAQMTLGEYPQGVPTEYLIAEATFASEQPFPEFPNIAKRVGLDTFSLAGSAICDDFDNDGNLDVVTGSYDPSDHLRVFWNRDGELVEGSSTAGLAQLCGGLNMVQTDYNNDGFVDIMVFRGGWLANQGRIPNSLLRNNGDRTFTDVTYSAGLAEPAYPTQTGTWADYDLDGDLDLYIGNESTPGNECPCQLFRNNGDETFTDVAAAAGVLNGRKAKGVVWGDFDGDNDPDLFVSNIGDHNRLYRNQGNGTFVDVAEQLQVTEPENSFPAWFWDYDNDGALDLFVSAYAGGIAELAGFATGKLDPKFPRMHLYRNNGHGGFKNVAAEVNLHKPHHPMGANFGDLDNDGFLDFYLGTGWPEYHELMPNAMYRNDGGKRFMDVTTAGRFGHLQKGHGISFADLDNDGDLDVFEQVGGFFRGDRFYDVLFENPGFGHHWVSLKLEGTQSNRAAIGARIRIDVREHGQKRSIYRWVNSGGSFGANPLQQLIGLGTAEQIDSLEVYWPKTGETQQFQNLQVDRWFKLVEGNATLEEIPRESFSLGEPVTTAVSTSPHLPPSPKLK